MSQPLTIVWMRQDLRLDDNPALDTAAKRGAVIPIYVWAPEAEGRWARGSASRWWLGHSIANLSARLRDLGSRLVITRGQPTDALTSLATETGADSVFWNRRYEPHATDMEKRVVRSLEETGVGVRAFDGSLLFPPGSVRTGQGGAFKVFTPFWNACLALQSPQGPIPAPERLPAPPSWPDSLDPSELSPFPRTDWAVEIRERWAPGETGAQRALQEFLQGPLASYSRERDRPDLRGTSRLSPHLHFGEISPRRVWHESKRAASRTKEKTAPEATIAFLRQLGWREFAHHLLHHFPHTAEEPLRQEFAALNWRSDPDAFEAWRRGRTGYPIVDAGMRELLATGWMHNRVRMVAASFLVKDLLIHWLEGATWFWDTLVDADLANNTLGWQWSAGCGADAAPFFRVFSPTMQGEKFDPDGAYVKRWVPELEGLPPRWIHRPWEAPTEVLDRAGVVSDDTYPRPIVNHLAARDRALAAFSAIKQKR